MSFVVTVLGSGSATPILFRNPSAHVVQIHERLFLFDCAEGTQMQMLRHCIKIHKLQAIFISHLHGDHFFGLVGLISTLHLLGRKQSLSIYGPIGLREIIMQQLSLSHTELQYPIQFYPQTSDSSGLIYSDHDISVEIFPLQHSIPTHGFMVKEHPKLLKIRKDFIETQRPDIEDIANIKSGLDYVDAQGNIFPNQEITFPPAHQHSYAYCSDTLYTEEVIPFIKEVDVLYHEATFLEDKKQSATEKWHSTARDAGLIAQKAHATSLMLGHFSARYRSESDLEQFKTEASEVFPHVLIARDGLRIDVVELCKNKQKN